MASFRRWLMRGRRWAPWIHALAAFAIGVVLYLILQQVIVFVLLGFGPLGLLGLLAPLAIAFLAFGGLGRAAIGRRAGWWLGLSAIPWFAVGVIVFITAQTSHGWDPSVPWPYLVAGLAPATFALLAHAGPSRAIAVACIVATIVLGVQAKSHADLVSAQQRLGSTIHPEVTSVTGFQPYGETHLAYPGTTSQALAWGYIKSGILSGPIPVQFVLTTDRPDVHVCGPALNAHRQSPEPQLTCTESGPEWSRTSADFHELARIEDGYLVRVTAPASTPDAVLARALDHAEPMDDRYYRHLLYGESGQYIPELDGLR